MKSYKALEDVLNVIILEAFQTVDLLWALMHKRNIITYDTGMGKTVTAAAIMRCLKNEASSRRFIMFVGNSQLAQTPSKVAKWTGMKVLPVTAQSGDIRRSLLEKNFLSYDILMPTHDTLNNEVFMNILYEYKDSYSCVIVDEAHKLSNFMEASSAFMLRALLRRFDNRYALTATPMTTATGQIASLMHMFDWEAVPSVSDAERAMSVGTPMTDLATGLVINRTRRDLGISNNYRVHPTFVEPHEHQVDASGVDLFVTTKAEGAENQIKSLLSILRSNVGRKGIIYVHHHKVRLFVEERLEQAGYRVGSIHGKMGSNVHEKRRQIFSDFEQNRLDVVVTSVTTDQDLDSDFVIFYEFNVELKQVIGRVERGLNPKTIDLYFIFTLKTGEIKHFLENIYERSLIVQQVVDKDYGEIVKAGELASRRG